MKKLFIGVGAFFVLVILVALVAPFLIPADTFKGQLLAQVKEKTGRDAKIDGEFRLSLLPRVEFVARKVSFANAPGGKAKNMVLLDGLNVQVALFPLLGGEVEIDAFVLEKPVINLEIDNAGKPNWEFSGGQKRNLGRGDSERAEPSSGSSSGPGLSGLKLGDVRLVDGRVSYSDARTGVAHRIDGINLSLSLPSLDSPMKADGSLIWNNEKIVMALRLSNPNGFLSGRMTEVETKIAASTVTLSFKDTASGGKTVKAGGALDLDVPSIRRLASWVGAELQAPGSGYGPLKIAGQVDVDGAKYAFRQATLLVDAIQGSGEVAFDGGGRKPQITGNLRLGKLDLNPYLPPEQKAPVEATEKPAAAGKKAPPADWSDDPIDLTGLNGVDASLDLTVDGILLRNIKIGQSNVKVTVKNGVLVTDLTKMALYEGTGRAKLTANGADQTARIAVTVDLTNFQAYPFLKDAADFDRLEGVANADLNVATQGRTQRELVSALGGSGKVTFLNGAIRGINLAAMLRNVASAFMDSSAKETQKTDFAELGGTYVIARGVLTNQDMLLKLPLLRVSGKGTVDLPKRRVDYRIEPKVVASTQGQGGTADAAGVKVPVVISGPWDNLSYKPDLAGALGGLAKDPKKALDSLKGLVPGVPGTGTSDPGKSAPTPAIPDAEDKLKKLFGR